MKRLIAAVWALTFILISLAGCKLSPPPDPNDPRDVGLVQAEVLMRNLQWASGTASSTSAAGPVP